MLMSQRQNYNGAPTLLQRWIVNLNYRLTNGNGIWTPNHLYRKRTLNHLAKL